jgi:hypothetical protein
MTASFFLAPLSAAKAQLRDVCLANFGVQIVRLAVCVYAVSWLGLGALGAALSTFVVMSLAHSFILGPMALRSAEVSVKRYAREVLARGIAPALAGGVTWLLLQFWAAPSSWVSLAICGALGGLVYLAGIVACCLDDQEKIDLFWLVRRAGERLGHGSRRVVSWGIESTGSGG